MTKVGSALEAPPSPPSARDGVKAERVVNPKVVCFALEAGASSGVGGGASGIRIGATVTKFYFKILFQA